MSLPYRLRAKCAVFALILTVIASALGFASATFLKKPEPDPVSSHEDRLAAARRALPRHGFIGYVGVEKSATVHVNGQYYLSQYALAPLVLVFNNIAPSLVLVNFPEHWQVQSFSELGLEMRTDFGSGVKLFHHRERR